MATVYLAQDLRHSRPVALKVLKPELSAIIGAERFLVEIRTTANLQHPHILPLFDSGQVEGTVYYVMPFVEGEALRDRLDREKQLPIEDAVRIATEVASALDYAHRQGVIHRDIKPENILLHDGRAMVADFGIALAASRTEGGSRLTETGMSLGTPHYMSPEQALGERNIDARTDVYALGCVLHEMLAGEPPFNGPTAQAVIARVLSGEPESVAVLRKTVPEHVADAILIALAKLPADRFASAALFAAALATPTDGSGTRRMTSSGHRGNGRGKESLLRRVAWPTTFAAALAVAIWGWSRPTPQPMPTRLSMLSAGLGGTGSLRSRTIDITPDGRSLIYLEPRNGRARFSLHHLAEAESKPLEHIPADFDGPAIAPDGRSVLALNSLSGQYYRFSVEGGRGEPLPRELSSAVNAVWADDGSIWLTQLSDYSRGLPHLLPDGTVEYPFGPELSSQNLQQILPGSRHALTVRAPVGTSFGPAFVLDLKSGALDPILGFDVVEMRYAAGVLVYVLSSGEIEATRFDLRARRPIGNSVQIAADVSLTGSGTANFALATNGTLVYVPEAPRTLEIIDRTGNARAALSEGRNYHIPRFSPDGRSLLTDFTSMDGRDVWRVDLASGTLSRVTFERDGHDADWEPDGRAISFISANRSTSGLTLLRTSPGRTSQVDSLLSSDSLGYTGVWLPDRSAIVTAGSSLFPDSRSDIAIVRNAGRGPIEPLVATRFDETFPDVSPDGRWLAYTSDQTGRVEVYVRPLDREGDEIRISTAGGDEPMWGPNGRELFYRALGDNSVALTVATLSFQPRVAVTARQALFDVADMATSTPHSNYDVSPDGRSFAMVRRNPASRIVVIQHLPELVAQLERRASP